VSEHSYTHPTTSSLSDEQSHAIIDERDELPDICTIYSTAPGDSVTTTWISAAGESYISLEDAR